MQRAVAAGVDAMPVDPLPPPLRAAAVREARDKVASRPLYLDTETTGLDERAEIVEICLLDADGAPLVDTLVKPVGRIPPDATRIHGISDAAVAEAPSWATVWPAVAAAIEGRRVGIYNLDFDLRLIRQCNQRWNIARAPSAKAFCIMKLYSRWHGELNDRGEPRWHKLEAAGRDCQIDLPNSHRARADALLARALLHHLAR